MRAVVHDADPLLVPLLADVLEEPPAVGTLRDVPRAERPFLLGLATAVVLAHATGEARVAQAGEEAVVALAVAGSPEQRHEFHCGVHVVASGIGRRATLDVLRLCPAEPAGEEVAVVAGAFAPAPTLAVARYTRRASPACDDDALRAEAAAVVRATAPLEAVAGSLAAGVVLGTYVLRRGRGRLVCTRDGGLAVVPPNRKEAHG